MRFHAAERVIPVDNYHPYVAQCGIIQAVRFAVNAHHIFQASRKQAKVSRSRSFVVFRGSIVSITQREGATVNLYDIVVDQQQVQTIPLDDLNVRRLDFYKLDVEGFEIAALRGAHRTIRRHRPFMWIEYWKTGLKAIKDELADVECYECLVIDPGNVLFAPQERVDGCELQITKR